MKLMTLNTHSLMEENYEYKLNVLVNAIVKYNVDVIALQEIMQPISGKEIDVSCHNEGIIPLKEGNHALNAVKKLNEKENKYKFAWVGFKKSYNSFDEGLAIITPHEISETRQIILSPFDDYENWRTRKALGALINGEWFYSVHTGWWESCESPLRQEIATLTQKTVTSKPLWLMGDFNSISSERDKGYDLLVQSGLYDTYCLAKNKDNGITAKTSIDGWSPNEKEREIRIDYIFSNKIRKIDSSYTVFNGKTEPIVSDHYGILVTTGEEIS